MRGGGGSGEVTTSYTRNIYEGLKIKEAEGKLQIFDALSHFYEENVKQQYAQGKENGKTVEPAVPEDLLQAARRFTDTAVITICRFPEKAGTGREFLAMVIFTFLLRSRRWLTLLRLLSPG